MDPTDIGLFHLAEQRLAWVDRRQRLLAQNVANANTPGWQAKDVEPFERALAGPTLQRTSPLHMQAASTDLLAGNPRPAARSPDGNAVSLEDQLMKVADTAGMQELALNLHHRYQSMLRLAMGRSS